MYPGHHPYGQFGPRPPVHVGMQMVWFRSVGRCVRTADLRLDHGLWMSRASSYQKYNAFQVDQHRHHIGQAELQHSNHIAGHLQSGALNAGNSHPGSLGMFPGAPQHQGQMHHPQMHHMHGHSTPMWAGPHGGPGFLPGHGQQTTGHKLLSIKPKC